MMIVKGCIVLFASKPIAQASEQAQAQALNAHRARYRAVCDRFEVKKTGARRCVKKQSVGRPDSVNEGSEER
jgi:hypothetical protein